MSAQNPTNPADTAAEGKGKGKSVEEPTQAAGMDVDDSSSEEEIDEVSNFCAYGDEDCERDREMMMKD